MAERCAIKKTDFDYKQELSHSERVGNAVLGSGERVTGSGLVTLGIEKCRRI